jgi:hypothetical protein
MSQVAVVRAIISPKFQAEILITSAATISYTGVQHGKETE